MLTKALALLPTVISTAQALGISIGHGEVIKAIATVVKDLGQKATIDQILNDVLNVFIPPAPPATS